MNTALKNKNINTNMLKKNNKIYADLAYDGLCGNFAVSHDIPFIKCLTLFPAC